MRVTNAMMTNTTLINISRNMRYLDRLIQQIESTKKIQRPSDDPIIANRSLKYNAIIAETEQYRRNIQSGLSWMSVTEAPFANIVEKLLKQIRERCVEASTGTETAQDKSAIVAELRELIEQIGLEMNQTYAGRYVFSGYRTDQPPVLVDDSDKTYVITQYFNSEDIEKTKSYQKLTATDEPVVNEVNILKLAYKNVDFNLISNDVNNVLGGETLDLGIFDQNGRQYEVIRLNSQDAGAYNVTDDGRTIHYIEDTGELVFGDQLAVAFQNGTEVTYYKEQLKKGDLNPLVYFDCVEMVDQIVMPPEIIVDQIVTSLQAPPVDSRGQFLFYAFNSSNPLERNQLLYTSGGIPSTSGPKIRINGGSAIDLWDINAADITSTVTGDPPTEWAHQYHLTDGNYDVTVIQRVSVVDNPPSMGGQSYNITYEVVNNTTDPVDFDFMYHVDTQLRSNDFPPYLVDGNMLFSGSYSGSTLPDQIEIFDSGTNPYLNGVITITSAGDPNPPDTLNIGHYSYTQNFNYTPSDPTTTTDTGYAVIWSGKTIAGGGSSLPMTTAYGVKNPPGTVVDISDPVTIKVPAAAYNMDNQEIQYEFAANTFVTINSLAKDVYTDKMYADLRSLCDFVSSLKTSDPKLLETEYKNMNPGASDAEVTKFVEERLAAETAQMNAVIYDRFNNSLYLVDRHAENAMREQTRMGSRMQRLELLSARLDQDETTYTELLANNEDTDLVKAIILRSSAEAAYQASLKAAANIVQMTLANFIG